MIVPKHRSRRLGEISFVPLKGNRILPFAKYVTGGTVPVGYLHLSIHEIRSDQRVGPALWSFDETVGNLRISTSSLEPMKSTENQFLDAGLRPLETVRHLYY